MASRMWWVMIRGLVAVEPLASSHQARAVTVRDPARVAVARVSRAGTSARGPLHTGEATRGRGVGWGRAGALEVALITDSSLP